MTAGSSFQLVEETLRTASVLRQVRPRLGDFRPLAIAIRHQHTSIVSAP